MSCCLTQSKLPFGSPWTAERENWNDRKSLLKSGIWIVWKGESTNTGLDRKKIPPKNVFFFLPISFNICFGCSKEPSHWDGSFEYPQRMFWLRNKKCVCVCARARLLLLWISPFLSCLVLYIPVNNYTHLNVPVNSYGHVGTVRSLNHPFSWASLKRLTSTLRTYFCL